MKVSALLFYATALYRCFSAGVEPSGKPVPKGVSNVVPLNVKPPVMPKPTLRAGGKSEPAPLSSSEVPPPIPAIGRAAKERKKDNSDLRKITIAAMGTSSNEKIILDLSKAENRGINKDCTNKTLNDDEDVKVPHCVYTVEADKDLVKIVDDKRVIWDAKNTGARAFYATLVLKDDHKFLSFRASTGNYKLETMFASDFSGKWEFVTEFDHNTQLAGTVVVQTCLDLSNPDRKLVDVSDVLVDGVKGLKYQAKDVNKGITCIFEREPEEHSAKEDVPAPKSEADKPAEPTVKLTGAAALIASDFEDFSDFEDDDAEDETNSSHIWGTKIDGQRCVEISVFSDTKGPNVLSLNIINPNGSTLLQYVVKEKGFWTFTSKAKYLEQLKGL